MDKRNDKGGSVLMGLALSIVAIGGTILLFAGFAKALS